MVLYNLVNIGSGNGLSRKDLSQIRCQAIALYKVDFLSLGAKLGEIWIVSNSFIQ